MAGLPLYFFLSYARLDGQGDSYLHRFVGDLRREVRARCGHPSAEEVGFLDTTSIQPGEAWSAELAEALRRCRTFVAICSRSFFASEYCGREWRAFEDRRQHGQESGGVRSPTLLPVIWTPLPDPPAVLAELQYDHVGFGKLYARHGLRYLLQLTRNHDEYQEFLVTLAERIVYLAENSALPPLTRAPDFDKIHSAFQPSGPVADRPSIAVVGSALGPDAAAGEDDYPGERDDAPGSGAMGVSPPGTPRDDRAGAPAEIATTVARGLPPGIMGEPAGAGEEGGGPKRVTFVLAVASTAELSRLRSKLESYGNQYDEWMPYHPRFPQRVCVSAQAVAARHDMSSQIVRLQNGISELLETSRKRNEVVIFIVDAWASQLDYYYSALREYDDRNEPFTGVLVPWNPEDAETATHATALKESLERALWKNVVRGDNFLRMEIHSQEEFDTSLLQLLVDTQARVFRAPSAVRRPSSPPRRRPFLDGP
ncbi:FxsC C-terminal domain [Frankia canadensis]|uniref:FxsC C-terminal domain n=1 Tax=Frankia canadensis TaxID=1836972 RepID=A0A2I2L1V2_9ACTN|nr:TIR-like protein FxsC [Frankia canadensis]SNQ51900.1 FxsC C-terminal domain [Frankia canadensis]SOU59190.1 FxsC C-terminal domain [Frankia canadensis]